MSISPRPGPPFRSCGNSQNAVWVPWTLAEMTFARTSTRPRFTLLRWYVETDPDVYCVLRGTASSQTKGAGSCRLVRTRVPLLTDTLFGEAMTQSWTCE